MRSEEELRNLLSKVADEIADFSGNPRTWLSWITYLMSELERRSVSVDSSYQELYQDLVYALRDAVNQRIKMGGW